MAFPTDSKIQVLKFLGYPLYYVYLDSVLDGLGTEALAEVLTMLDELADIEERLSGYARDVAGISKVNTLEFAAGQAIADLEHAGRTQVDRLANALGVKVMKYPFGGGSGGGPGALFFGA